MAGAGAAGPALEGGVVKTGMRAVEGAVSYVRLEQGTFYLTVIGGGAPQGLCGSGIVDLIAQLYLNGLVDLRGKLIPESGKLEQRDGEWAVCYAPGLYFYQSDIDAFLQTKAAANTMVEYMLDALGVPMDQVGKFFVAGAFGTHLDKESAVTIGLYPDLPRDRIVSAGNTSLRAPTGFCATGKSGTAWTGFWTPWSMCSSVRWPTSLTGWQRPKPSPIRICPDTLPSAESFWPADGWPKADSLEEKRYAGMLSA